MLNAQKFKLSLKLLLFALRSALPSEEILKIQRSNQISFSLLENFLLTSRES